MRNVAIIKIVFIILFSCFLSSCTTSETDELTEKEKSAIIAELEQQWEISCDGIAELDAEKTFSLFSKKEGAKYIREEYLYPDIETAKNQYDGWFKSPEAVKRKITSDPIFFDFLDKNTVLMTTIGSLEIIGDTTNQEPWIVAYTLLWTKEEAGWKVFHAHMSWEKIPSI